MNEAELLFCETLNYDRMSLYLNKDKILNKERLRPISSALRKRIKGEPIQYIIGKAEFMGFEFRVTPDCLIPRPETEILVETAIKIVRRMSEEAEILDLGTGSGCIAISLARLIPGTKITATDISAAALKIARLNAKSNNVNIVFLKGALFQACGLRPKAYDLIISNPPYVASSQIKRLQPEVQFEPVTALDGGKEGLDFYKRIINDAPQYLKKRGFLIFEIGFNQADAVKKNLQNSGYFEIIEVIKDYSNLDRVIVSKKLK